MMNLIRATGGLILLAALVVTIQLGGTSGDSPVAAYRGIPDGGMTTLAQTEARGNRHDRALLLLDYAIERGLPDQDVARALRTDYYAQLTTRTSTVGLIHGIGWTADATGDNAYASLAGGTVADASVRGAIASLDTQGALENPTDELVNALNGCKGMAAVFPPASQAITLAKAARASGAINNVLALQLQSVLNAIRPAPQSAAAVEQFRETVMPLFELARQCRTWTEFHILLLQADSAAQVKVLTRMASTGPSAARQAARVLTIASRSGGPSPSKCLDHILRHGQQGLEALHAAAAKGIAGLDFAVAHPAVTASAYQAARDDSPTLLEPAQQQYRELHQRHGAVITLVKYWLIALLSALMILTFVPGVYLEKLVVVPGKIRGATEPGAAHHLMVAIGVGIGISALTYVFAMAISPASDQPSATGTGEGTTLAATVAGNGDNALLSGAVVALSLLAHTVIWFWVRSKLRQVEEDDAADAAHRLQRLENLDTFLDLPLFTGLALTVIAFILITFNAGMSRHFAYTSTVVGILSAVSLRVLFLYPLKERLIRSSWSART
jgi:hypothetical protein